MKSTGHGPRAAWAALTAGALLAVSGCGGGSSESGADSGARPSGGTRTVHHTMNGDVSGVPRHPQRVVALWRTGAELADMGVEPVAALEGEFLQEELDERTFAKVKDVPTVGSFEGVDVEKVIRAKPDLIVGMDNGGLSIDYKELSEIAPTVVFKIAEPPDVWKNYPRLADAVGRSTGFDKRDAALKKDLAAIERRHGSRIRNAKAVHVNVTGDATFVSTSKSLVWERLDAAGFGYLPSYTHKPARYAEELSDENIPELKDADLIFYSVDLHGKKTPGMDELLASASFKRLPAAEAGDVFPLGSGVNFTFRGGDQQVADLTRAATKYRPAHEES
ncbi:ABC transporter substrate-binding protein [Streptomyces nanshensis]|uniref:Fe/B12 periplasmic-binding domain-containing protein n=1 Tax=Streptomyces nanshensis TaxID=518642 RepID=A0A1E7KZZ0_9ACTN|nr:ABC transporter substrate-binding protein [Streptomyces nanshensis]OEV09484.1 hypothetical protein AN218_21785 [Streptomyces nanshensis]